MIWIREEEVFTRFDYGSVEQRCRELDLHGLCGDVRREDPEAPPPLFYHYFCLDLCLSEARLPLDGAQKDIAD